MEGVESVEKHGFLQVPRLSRVVTAVSSKIQWRAMFTGLLTALNERRGHVCFTLGYRGEVSVHIGGV